MGGFKGLRPPTKLISGLYNQAKDTDDDGNRIDGICEHCKQWDAELVNGFCRDRECRQSRLDEKVKAGTAIRISNDVFVSGGVGTAIERGGRKYAVRRKNGSDDSKD